MIQILEQSKEKSCRTLVGEFQHTQILFMGTPPKPTEIPLQEIHRKLMDLDNDINRYFEENSPYQKVLYQKHIKDLIAHISKNHQNLDSLISTGKLVQRFLSKQANIDKILKSIQRKVLKGTHLPVTVKEIQAGYLISLSFKDLYLYLAQNKLPSTKTSICKVETLAEKYILLDSFLLKLITTPQNRNSTISNT